MIIKCGLTAFKISVSLSLLNWIKNEMIFQLITELMLATLIPRYKKKIISFFCPVQERVSDATFYDCINTIYQFIEPFLDNKMSIFEEYGAFKVFRHLTAYHIYPKLLK